jgi:hypothetical protein
MTEKEVLGLEPAPRLEQIGGEHRIGFALILPRRANPAGSNFREPQGSKAVNMLTRALGCVLFSAQTQSPAVTTSIGG